MDDTLKIESDGWRWFFIAGGAAVLLTLFLVWTDSYLSNSKREEILRDTLYDLRTAQASLPSEVSDPRQLQSDALPSGAQ